VRAVPVRVQQPQRRRMIAGRDAASTGLDADHTELVMPELVSSMMVTFDQMRDGDLPKLPDTEIKTIDSSALTYALVNAIKELAARVAALEDMLTGAAR